jgi:excisionase family DNA binding protein
MEKTKLFLRSVDVAHLLDCSPDEVYPLAKRGELPAIKRGRHYRFRYEDVAAYKEEREKEHEKG